MAQDEPTITVFVSPHGYGHAARAAAIMEALQEHIPTVVYHLFTTIPAAFFASSGLRHLEYHTEVTDIGFVHRTAFQEDIPQTVHLLDQFVPFAPERLARLAADVCRTHSQLVLTDIAPLGIAVAHLAGVPSVLVENFTWSGLYPFYSANHPQMAMFASYFSSIEQAADFHIQTEPLCAPVPGSLRAEPVSRRPHRAPSEVRRDLGVSAHSPLALVTLSGSDVDPAFCAHFQQRPDWLFLIPGANTSRCEANVIRISSSTPFHHPDLVGAADVVIGKAGYSTISEVYHAGVPFGYITRDRYPETPPLVTFIDHTMPSRRLEWSSLLSGQWLQTLDELRRMPRVARNVPNGADTIARLLVELLA